MASPAPSTTSASNGPTKPTQITFRFCRECSNMLYPKEDRMTNKLMFACRTCQFSEEAQSSCVFRNNLYNTVGETAGVTQDVGSDPTVSEDFDNASSRDGGDCNDGGDFTCTYCGGELGDEFVELSVGDAGKAVKVVGDVEGKGTSFDLSEMSTMEEEDMDMDGESDNGLMDEGDNEGEEPLKGEVQGSHSQD